MSQTTGFEILVGLKHQKTVPLGNGPRQDVCGWFSPVLARYDSLLCPQSLSIHLAATETGIFHSRPLLGQLSRLSCLIVIELLCGGIEHFACLVHLFQSFVSG